jgi:hypothetical protein
VYEELVSRARSGYVGESWMASAAEAAGRIDEARAHAQRGVDERETWALYWKRTTDWAAFREDPVGVEIMKASALS